MRLILLSKDASGQFSATADINFLKDRFEMILDRVRGNMKGRRNLRGRPPVQNTLDHLPFPFREMIRLEEEWCDFDRLRLLENDGDLSLTCFSAQP